MFDFDARCVSHKYYICQKWLLMNIILSLGPEKTIKLLTTVDFVLE